MAKCFSREVKHYAIDYALSNLYVSVVAIGQKSGGSYLTLDNLKTYLNYNRSVFGEKLC